MTNIVGFMGISNTGISGSMAGGITKRKNIATKESVNAVLAISTQDGKKEHWINGIGTITAATGTESFIL